MTTNQTIEVVNTSRGQNPLILSLQVGKGRNKGMTLVIPPHIPTRDNPRGNSLSLSLEQLRSSALPLSRYVGSKRAEVHYNGAKLSVEDLKALAPEAFKKAPAPAIPGLKAAQV